MLHQAVDAAGLHDDPEQQELLHRCLQVLHSSRAPEAAEVRPRAAQWRRCVQPSKEGPRVRGGATLTTVGSSLWLIGGLDSAGPVLTPDVFSLDTSVEPSAWALEHTAERGTRFEWGGLRSGAERTPAARFGHAACARGKFIWLFGGHSGPASEAAEGESGMLADTHALDTITCTWAQAHAAEPPLARHAHTLCYDAHGDRLLLFGGADQDNRALDGLHALPLGSVPRDSPPLEAGEPDARVSDDGVDVARPLSSELRWVAVQTSGGGPSAREMHASVVTLNSATGGAPGVMVVHGGRLHSQLLSDLWVLHLGARGHGFVRMRPRMSTH